MARFNIAALAEGETVESWGRYPRVAHRGVLRPACEDEVLAALRDADTTVLPRGLGRSYGDSCLNAGGYLVENTGLKAIHEFDPEKGRLRCGAGVTLDEILRLAVPHGWFLPVTPGTKFVTVGGAIANDVHGKNHHRAGNFGHHVLRLELLRSNGERIVCSEKENADWFAATVGGLGLTGFILGAEIQLKPISGPFIEMESIKFDSFDEFVEISSRSDKDFEYTVAWLDCLGGRGSAIRGIFIRGNHSAEAGGQPVKLHPTKSWKSVPFDAPSCLLSTPTVRAFNFLYYHKQFAKRQQKLVHYDPFFYPLDGVRNWNRMYGRRGFLQWQCVVPFSSDNAAILEILGKIKQSGLASFLVVLKEFGDRPSRGLLSFPMPGVTLALDFANRGKPLFALLEELDRIVVANGGRIYPAKDARMSAKTFAASFPRFREFSKYIDPKISSSFYRRIKEEP
ncbi:MAG: FAD-binding oxidoreductase [Calditrichaeota bacterium]|nr:MAG: FAD-binding oxidoreductase [Calditrichota bacterium]